MTIPDDEKRLLQRIQPMVDVAHDYLDAVERGRGQAEWQTKLDELMRSAEKGEPSEPLTISILVSINRMRQQVKAHFLDTPYLNRRIPLLAETYIAAAGTVADKLTGRFGNEMETGILGLALAHFEDTRAFSAIVVADRTENMTNQLLRHIAIGQLHQSYDTSQGSGAKIALAYALHRFGDDSLLGPVGIDEAISDVRKRAHEATKNMGLTGEETAAGSQGALEIIMRANVVKLVSLDIASFGRALTRLPNGSPWVKGRYNKEI